MKIKNVKKQIKKYEEKNLDKNSKLDKNNKFTSILDTPNTVIATDFTHLYWK